jgi:4'-phosphopantetheinyl transferase
VFPILHNDEVHLWLAALDLSAAEVQALESTLAADEAARAARYRFAQDRRHYVAARGQLRTLLGRYLDIAPDAVRFRYSRYGKPALAHGDETLRFNLSHSGGMALYALTRERDLGVDLERVRPDRASMTIAERFFSPREAAILRSLPLHEQAEAFFRCWTRKEAYIKAHGAGFSLPLDRFDVTLAADEPAALVRMDDNPREVERWSLRDVSPLPGYSAALAIEGHGWRLQCWHWPLAAAL